jgi:hypothetical protein
MDVEWRQPGEDLEQLGFDGRSFDANQLKSMPMYTIGEVTPAAIYTSL